MRLDGKKALVTGSGRGIGRAIAVRFAREGADVVINDINIEGTARETLAEVEATGRRGLLIQADLSRTDEARRLIDEAFRQLGPLDILVNNAGIEKRAPFVEVTEEDYDKVLSVNLKGAFFTTQAFVRHLLAAKRPGKIIHISSVHEELPFPGFSTYCASKGGLQLLTRDLAVELGRARHHGQRRRAGRDRDRDQPRPARRQTPGRAITQADPARPDGQAGRRRRRRRIPRIIRRRLCDRLDLLR